MIEYKAYPKPIIEDDSFIELALKEASIPTLIMSLIHMTGDKDLLAKLPKPQPPIMGETQGFMEEIEKEKVRKFALQVIRDYRDSKKDLPSMPDKQTLLSMMEFMVSSKIPKEYVALMFEEMDLEGKDPRRVTFSKTTLERIPKDYTVIVIGAGMSGILAGMRLKQAGINFRIIEKNNDIGGTWFENSYPGSRVDIANHFFCYSFFPNFNWSEHFAQQPEILDYFRKFVERFSLKDSIDFNSAVTEASYDEEAKIWKLIIEQSGRTKLLKGNILISAVGQLNRPKIPKFSGKENFSGKEFHSSRWDHSYKLEGKRVGVIGTGASSFQFVPEIAKQAKELKVFQRSAPWMYPNNNYHEKVSLYKKWLLKHIPYYARWYRFLLFWPGSDGLMPSLTVDPDWPFKDRSINSLNEVQRKTFTDNIKQRIGEDLELLAKVIPSYPPFVKRILQDNGNWLKTLKRINVKLITDNIKEILKEGIKTDDGVVHELDTIIYATGFHGSEFLSSLDIKGRERVSLRETWGDDPEAYLGITIPNFPNLFCLYGPATNLAHAGTIIFNSECQMKYIMECIKFLIDSDLKEMECKEDVNRKYNENLQQALSETVFSHESTDSWYKNSEGKVVTTSPWLLKDYWKWTSSVNPEDFWFS